MAFSMNFIPTQEKLDLQEVKQELEAAYPDHRFNFLHNGKTLAMAEPGRKAAVVINPMKKKVMLSNGFLKVHQQIVFGVLMLLFLGLIPISIYYFGIRPKQNRARAKAYEIINSKFGPASF